MSDEITKTIDGLEVWNPLQHGIHNEGLKVCASAHNKAVFDLQSRIASLEERENILKHEKETLGNDLDEAFDLVCKSDFINQRELLSILERNDDLYGFE